MHKLSLFIFIFVFLLMNINKSNIAVDSLFGEKQVSQKTQQHSLPEQKEEEPQMAENQKIEYPQIIESPLLNRSEFALSSEGIFCLYDGSQYGFMKEDGKIITSYCYDYAYPFSEGLACVSRNGKYGFIDEAGYEAIPFIYDKANSFSEGLAYFEIGNRYGFIDDTGNEVILLNCDSVSSFHEGLAYFSIDGKYGYISKIGDEVIKPIYDETGYFYDGIAKVRCDDKIGIINKAGDEIIPVTYDDITKDNGFIITRSNYKYGCFNQEGEILLPAEYDDINIEDNKIVFKLNEKYGLADENGNIMINPIYDWIGAIPENNSVMVELNGRWGIVDDKGKIEVPVSYETMAYQDGMIQVSLDAEDKVGFLDATDFTEVIPRIYDNALHFTGGYAPVQLEKWGVIDKKGNIVVPFDYDETKTFPNGMMALGKNGKFYLADHTGNVLTEKRYDSIEQTGECFEVKAGIKYGFLNESGEEIIPPFLDSIYDNTYYSGNYKFVREDEDSGFAQSMIKIDDSFDADMSDLLLKNEILRNEITPKINLFHDYLENIFENIKEDQELYRDDNFNEYRSKFSLYGMNGSKTPVLYAYIETIDGVGYRETFSGLFSIQNDAVLELLTGYECGGSAGGDYITLYKDKETSNIVFGTCNYAGGFGGLASGADFYDYQNGKVQKLASYYEISQQVTMYEENVLLENPELFYDGNDEPCTKDNILEESYVTEYIVNDKQSTISDYKKVENRFTQIQMGFD